MNDIAHRSWPLPSKNWIIRQTWSNLLFIHWPISPELLRPHIPSSLQIDTYNRTAWLGVVYSLWREYIFADCQLYHLHLNFRRLMSGHMSDAMVSRCLFYVS